MPAGYRLQINQGERTERPSSRDAMVRRSPIVRSIAFVLALMTSVASAGQARSQGIGAIPASLPTLQPRMAVPFDTGEKLTFDVRFGAIKVGTGRMEVVGMQDVRGREAWHTRFTVKGGIPFYKVNDRIESWIDTRTFSRCSSCRTSRRGGATKSGSTRSIRTWARI